MKRSPLGRSRLSSVLEGSHPVASVLLIMLKLFDTKTSRVHSAGLLGADIRGDGLDCSFASTCADSKLWGKLGSRLSLQGVSDAAIVLLDESGSI